MKHLIIVIMIFAAVPHSSAQTVINDSPTENRAYVRFGIEPATMITLGYQRNFNVRFLNRHLAAYVEWEVPMFRFSFKNSDFKLGGILPIIEKRSFKIVNTLNFSVGGISTRNFNSNKVAFADEAAFGFYKKVLFIAATVEYERILLNHIEHTDFYKKTYFEDAKDGWYKGGGGMFQFGIEGGVAIKEKYDIHLELKFPFTERFNRYGGLPFHANLGLGYRF